MIHLVINSRMNLTENKLLTLDDDPAVLVNQLAFLSAFTKWKKGFDSVNLLTAFFGLVDKNIPKAQDEFEKNEKGTLIKLNNLIMTAGKPLTASVEHVKEMAYQKPDFEKVWNTVSNNATVNGLGLEKWVALAQSGKDSKISKPSMDNVLDYDPTIKAKDDLKYSSVNMPIIFKSPMGDYHLLSGNAELNGIMDMHGNAKVWYVDGSKVNDESI